MSEQKPNDGKQGLKEFGLSSFSVDNAVSIFVIMLIILVFGVHAYNTMPKESFPEIAWPKIYINTVYFGNSASDIENLISKPIEKELATISEKKNVTSSSLQDYSLIVAEFDADVDLDDATRKVKDAVDRARPELPSDLTKEPEILDINFSEIPILTVNISGDYSNDELRMYAEYLEDKIEDVPEVSKVDMKGDLEREVKIDIDVQKMKGLEISFGDIENAIRAENLTMSGGELVNNDFRRTIRVIGEFQKPEEVGNVIIKSENQMPVFLKDFATVVFGFKERTSIARADGLPVISLDIIKRSGENLLNASDKIKAIVGEAKEDYLPKDLTVSLFNDQSVDTRNMVSNLENSIISGILLVVLVLLFFMGIRNSMFVGVAIPLSMLLGFLVLNLIGYSLNMVVLFSLILALGMLVDNAIVVVENIYRYMQAGYSGRQAAKFATGEVAVPIISSTATTLAAFVPLAFWPGLMGSFMQFLPITLIVTLSASLFVALVINPVLASKLMKVEKPKEDAAVRKRRQRNTLISIASLLGLSLLVYFAHLNWMRNLLWIAAGVTFINVFILRDASMWFQRRVEPALEYIYDHFIRYALKHPFLVLGGTVLLLIMSMVLMGLKAPKTVLFPTADPRFVNAFVELPLGKDIEATDRLMKEMEGRVQKVIEPYKGIVEAVLSQIGENTADPSAAPEFGAAPNKARLTVSFVPAEKRGDISTVEVMEKIRRGLEGIPGVQVVVDKNSDGPPVGKPINIEVKGDDITKLTEVSDAMVTYIASKNIGGIDELKKDVNLGKPELIVKVDREAARRYEISTYAIADAIRTAVFGKEVSKFKQDDEDYPIFIRMDEKSRNNLDQVLNQSITFRSMASGRIVQVPVSAFAKVEYTTTYNAINRKNQQRIITIYSNVLDGFNPNEVVADVRDALSQYDMPEGYTYAFTGEQEEQAENMAFLSTAFLVALFAVFFIIVAQFNSISSPLIIMTSVLFSTIGVLLGYVLVDMDIEIVMSGVGIISLAGVVVNNAIVLLDYTQLTIKRKAMDLNLVSHNDLDPHDVKESIVHAGATRLRPVILTAFTTVLGLIPLAVGFNFNFFSLISDLDPQIYWGGDNAAFWGTLAWTVVFGLTFATFLTLIVVPVMFWLTYKSKLFFSRVFASGSKFTI
jgi:multidrug efflux pump subunit AcrB